MQITSDKNACKILDKKIKNILCPLVHKLIWYALFSFQKKNNNNMAGKW